MLCTPSRRGLNPVRAQADGHLYAFKYALNGILSGYNRGTVYRDPAWSAGEQNGKFIREAAFGDYPPCTSKAMLGP